MRPTQLTWMWGRVVKSSAWRIECLSRRCCLDFEIAHRRMGTGRPAGRRDCYPHWTPTCRLSQRRDLQMALASSHLEPRPRGPVMLLLRRRQYRGIRYRQQHDSRHGAYDMILYHIFAGARAGAAAVRRAWAARPPPLRNCAARCAPTMHPCNCVRARTTAYMF
eukprot:COSAG05_NODE_956_length_6433_cov_1.774708_4_plen_164_part_00